MVDILMKKTHMLDEINWNGNGAQQIFVTEDWKGKGVSVIIKLET
jgi:hypothetical protein